MWTTWRVPALLAVVALQLLLGCGAGSPRSALVWRSEVSNDRVNAAGSAPVLRSSALQIEVDVVMVLDGDQPLCTDSVQYAKQPPSDLERCLLLQYRLQYESGPGGAITVRAPASTSDDGASHGALTAETLVVYPGAADTLGSALFPNVGEGSTITFETEQDGDSTSIDFVVPTDGFEPVEWSPGLLADERV